MESTRWIKQNPPALNSSTESNKQPAADVEVTEDGPTTGYATVRGHSNNTWHSRGGGGGSTMCHTSFFYFFKTVFLKLLETKSFVWQQDQALKDTFFLNNFGVKSKEGLKTIDQKWSKCHTGGVRKVPKKCHVLFEWPLTLIQLKLLWWQLQQQ